MGALLKAADGSEYRDSYSHTGLIAVLRENTNSGLTWVQLKRLAEEHGTGGAIQALEEELTNVMNVRFWKYSSGAPLTLREQEYMLDNLALLLTFLRRAHRNASTIEWDIKELL